MKLADCQREAERGRESGWMLQESLINYLYTHNSRRIGDRDSNDFNMS